MSQTSTNMAPASQFVGTKAKILSFLGAGIPAEKVASVVGCEPSYISQLLADEEFFSQVSAQRFEALAETTARDDRINSLEDRMLTRAEQLLESPMAYTKPSECIRDLVKINSLKRRGAGEALGGLSQHTPVVQLVLPGIVTQKFTASQYMLDTNNQIIQAGEQTLVTISSGSMLGLATLAEGHSNAALSTAQHSIQGDSSHDASSIPESLR
jgi:hypothetical protein